MDGSERIAIVGIGGVFPGASSLDEFWANILACRDAAADVPDERWPLSVQQIFAPQLAPDRVYSRRACLVDSVELDRDELLIDSSLLARLDPMFHVLLAAGQAAWRDGVTGSLDRQRVGVIVGNIALPTEATAALADEIFRPMFESALGLSDRVARTTPASGIDRLNRYVLGLPAGVLAAALGLGGGTATVDSACASSLYALKLAAEELLSHRADAMLTGGLSRPDCLYTQMGFSQLRALSSSGRCAPFDAAADGLVVGEGAGVLLLKRLSDALRDGDHVYAVIHGLGLSNDLAGNLMSPDREGQLRAIRAAYEHAGWAPHEVDLIECHGTGTPVGDKVELRGLAELWQAAPPGRRGVIGSVKSNVGHLLTAAGAAGTIKVLLALKHQLLPPSANFESLPPEVAEVADVVEILRQPRQWPAPADGSPRRAAVSAFGFGGINAHMLLEEWPSPASRDASGASDAPQAARQSPAIVVRASRDQSPRHDPREPIAIVGMGAHFGPWPTLRDFQRRVLGGDETTAPGAPKCWWGHPDAEAYRGYFVDDVTLPLSRFRIPPRELEEMLPQQLLLLKVAAEALDDANRGDTTEPRLTTGVFAGLGLDLNTTNFHVRWLLANHARRWADTLGLSLDDAQLDAWIAQLREAAGPPLDANRTMGALGGVLASRVARAFRIGGPCFNISSEESSALRAVEMAVRSLQRGELDVALVGAVDLAGDLRAVLADAAGHAIERNGSDRPSDGQANELVIGEGAAAVVLKRASDARRDGDRIYALLRGVGAACGGGLQQVAPTEAAYRAALQRAYADTGVDPATIGLVETHGSGKAEKAATESAALASFFGPLDRSVPCGLASASADVGHAGAASGMAALVKTALCLYHEIIPPLRQDRELPTPLAQCESLFAPVAPQYWLRNREDGPRRAGVGAMSVDGNCVHVVLEGVEQPLGVRARRLPLGERREALFAVEGDDEAGLLAGLDQLTEFSTHAAGLPLAVLAWRWRRKHRMPQSARRAVALVAADRRELAARIAEARAAVAARRATSSEDMFYSPAPLGHQGEAALVVPGAGNQFAGMGRALGAWWPEIMRRQDQENLRLAEQFADGRFWTTASPQDWTHSDVIFAQVCLGSMVADLLAEIGFRPQAVLGYSLGESAGMFATRTWLQRDDMLARMRASPLFVSDLCGPCHAVRRAWQLDDDEPVDWQIGVLPYAVDDVRRALAGRSRVFLLIVNTPRECVVGGDRGEVLKLARDLGCVMHPITGVTTVHCEVVEPVSRAYRELHRFDPTPQPQLRYYSTAWAAAYEIGRERSADSMVEQARRGFDFARLIETAYADGVRVFVETGPGGSCARMIDQILGRRLHLARAVCVPGRDDVGSVLRLAAQLTAERVPLDLDKLCNVDLDDEVSVHTAGTGSFFGQLASQSENSANPKNVPVPLAPARTVTIHRRGERLRVPAPPQPRGASNGNGPPAREASREPIATLPSAPQSSDRRPADGRLDARAAMTPVLTQMAATEAAHAQAQGRFLDVSRQVSDTVESVADFQRRLFAARPAPRVAAPVALDRAACLEFAVGSIARVLGPEFAAVDAHPTRVRLPDEPLMLVDRIVTIEGRPRSLGAGRVVTEHDVREGGWYLENGHMPTSLAVEAGQADLFLSAYLGIDFQTRGLAVYRLLDAAVTFHRELPRAGETVCYDIHIERFFRQDNTHLFRFRFDATIDGEPLLSMRDGCAGFFSAAELAAGQGVVLTSLDTQAAAGTLPGDWQPLVPLAEEAYDDVQIAALRAGDLMGCFGERFAALPLAEPLGLPSGRMSLIDRIVRLDPAGGRYGLGQITGEADVHADDWFIACHFVDDRVMPGTLMYESSLQTLRVFMLRLGWVGEAGQVVCEPLPGVASQLKCRGQVTGETRRVRYEVSIKDLGYSPDDSSPYAIADALMYADGKPIVQMKNMSLRMRGLNREQLTAQWSRSQASPQSNWHSSGRATVPVQRRRVLFDRQRILTFAEGQPSEAFGERYRPFDHERFIARLPRPPYLLVDRIVEVRDGEAWKLKAGATVEAEYDVPPDGWYFAAHRQPVMPFSVLLEVALQPCGWLAAYLGAALASDEDLAFRNLGGRSVQLADVSPDSGTLTTTARLTNVAHTAGMFLLSYDMQVRDRRQVVYEGDTQFGFFTRSALENQVGIREARLYEPSPDEVARCETFRLPSEPPYPDAMLRMIDHIDRFDPRGGPHGLGWIEASIAVDPEAWFFTAHFYQDPVWPGSLGLEAMLQLMKLAALRRWPPDRSTVPAIQAMAHGQPHRWVYRGQIVPSNRRVTVQAVVTAADDAARRLKADGYLAVDGRVIYEMRDFSVRLTG